MVKNLPAMRRTRFYPWVRKTSWPRKWRPTPVFLAGKSHGQRSLAGYIHGVAELDMTEQLHFTSTGYQLLLFSHQVEKGVATHSSILAWRTPMDRGAWRAAVSRVAKVQT